MKQYRVLFKIEGVVKSDTFEAKTKFQANVKCSAKYPGAKIKASYAIRKTN